jgi:hypothetical protein
MTGDDKRRFCEQCQLHVHNLSAMSEIEQQTLLAQRSGRKCIAYVATDHSIQVRPSTWLLLQRFLRSWRAGLALLAVLLPFATSSCATTHQETPQPPPPETTASKPARDLGDGKIMMVGYSMSDPPLWRRIIFFWER